MDLTNYFNDAPSELELAGREPKLQLLKVYAYNAYFDADITHTEDVNNGCTIQLNGKSCIDGVYLNEKVDETSVDCVFSYFVGNGPFILTDVLNAISRISSELGDVKKGIFAGNKQADDLIKDYLEDPDINKVIIRIITDYTCDANEKYFTNKKIEQFDVSVKNLDVSVVLEYGDDVKTVIESNRAPFDWVEEGKLIIDKPKNYLTFGDHSFVCNISAKSLKELWQKEGSRGLLAMNLRYYIKSANIDNKIDNSIQNDNQDFWYLNNGIIIVCNEFDIVDREIRLKQFSIVNGGQTSRMIGTTPFEGDFYICCKVIKNIFETSKEKNIFISKVAEASNTQKPIKAKDIIANRIEQRDLKSLMSDNGVFIEIKRGEKCNCEIYKEQWQRTKNNELAQDLYSFVYMQPGPARNSVSSILSNEDKYSTIFRKHEYSFSFLRDILFLEKAYKEYQKKINKDESGNESATKKGLVKNGLWYCLATIGYILKINYNPEYRDNMYKYRNNQSKFEDFSPELAFMHGFIDRNLTFKEFKTIVFDLFDFVFGQLIVKQFEVAKSENPSIAYSNWMKSNKGFDNIRDYINIVTFDTKQNYIIDAVSKYFVKIDSDTEAQNVDRYVDYCKKNKRVASKDSDGNELSAYDEGLRNDLMIFRLTTSQEKHIPAYAIFTDKMLDKLIAVKPINKYGLAKIIGEGSTYHHGDKILAIIVKYL